MGLTTYPFSTASPDPVSPSARGRRTILATLFRRAEVEPTRLFGSSLVTERIEDGFRDITFVELAKAVDACAWHLKKTFGTSDRFEPLLYMGANDYRYAVVLFAAIKCGYQAVFISPKQPIESVLEVINKLDCFKALYSLDEATVISNIHSRRPAFESAELAPLSHWLDALASPFPYKHKTWEESKNEPVLSLHSSGTTGPPKPITLRNGFFFSQDVLWPVPPGDTVAHIYDSADGCQLSFSIFPQAHMGGLCANVIRPLFTTCATFILPSIRADHTQIAELTLKILQERQIENLTTTPFLPARRDIVGLVTAAGTPVLNCYGTTEIGLVPGLRVDHEDHEYFHINPNYKATFEPSGDEEETHELILRQDDGDETLHAKRGIFWTATGLDVFRTKDLFLPHPAKPDLWKFDGRRDDILILAQGGMVNPIAAEESICSHKGVSGAIMTGENRHPPCVLIEPTKQVSDYREFVEEIWPYVEKGNARIRGDNRIPKEMIAVLEVGGLSRGIKGQVLRRANTQKYATIIDGLYTKTSKTNGVSV